jgi:hypothetical protein
MGQDSNGQFVPDTREIATGVRLQQSGPLSVTTKTALAALSASVRSDGLEAVVAADGSKWVFDADSTLADTTSNLVVTPDAGDGRWIRTDQRVHLKLAVGFATADAAVLFTVPAGKRLSIDRTFWEVTADWTGGTSSAIGASSATAPHDTKGDLLGGAGGDVAADLQAADGVTGGTVGASFGSNGVVVLDAADIIRFDRIVDAFTAGAGFIHVLATQIT